MQTRKEIATRLDLASDRAGEFGSTAKQNWFLAGLIEKAGEEADTVITSGHLTRKEASFYIDQYLREEEIVKSGLTRTQARMKMMGANVTTA